MAKQNVKEKAIEETLWQSCDKLRGSVIHHRACNGAVEYNNLESSIERMRQYLIEITEE